MTLGDSLPMDEWLRARARQLAGRDDGAAGLAGGGLSDEMPMRQWQRIRDWQVRGDPLPWERSTAVQLAAAGAPAQPQPKGPLTGRPGTAAIVAGALNTIASGPNTSAPLPLEDQGVNGMVRRGPDRDIHAEGAVNIHGLGSRHVGAEGTLDPLVPGRAEISASGVRSTVPGLGLPPRVRIYTTPTGELDIQLPEPIKVWPGITVKPAGAL